MRVESERAPTAVRSYAGRARARVRAHGRRLRAEPIVAYSVAVVLCMAIWAAVIWVAVELFA